jgi:hypothetical protein
MQAVSTSVPVIFNSAINAALLKMRNTAFGGPYDPYLRSCYVAGGADVNMDVFYSAQTNGDTSEGWTTAFLLDLMDTVNEANNGNDGGFGRIDHGDLVSKIQLINNSNL